MAADVTTKAPARGGVRRRIRAAVVATAVLAVGGSIATAAAAPNASVAAASTGPLRILVTNDDGVGAPGINILVNLLQTLPDVQVTVMAPAANQSGAGVNVTTGNITIAPATTSSGDAATAVGGTPADSVYYAVLHALPQRPHVVVSGVNFGQNLGNFTEISGTVGAARIANHLGIPAIAVSAGIGSSPNYVVGALWARGFVDALRDRYLDGSAPAQTLNINAPTCPTGSDRGLALVPLGRTSDISGYTLQSGSEGNGVVKATVVTQNGLATANCNSTLMNPKDDIEAFNNGFVTASVVNPDLGDR
jgi:5'-nucleotidase